MPLTMLNSGESTVIKRVGGKADTKRFLENLGFVTGAVITLISQMGGDVIVKVKESRIAINQEMARKIMV